MSGQRKAEASRWFQQASYDLQAARWNTEGGFHDTACFIAQQAGEKALKSLLYYLGARRTALTTHSILRMIEEAQPQVGALGDVLEEARDLDLHSFHLATRTACQAAIRTSSTARTWLEKLSSPPKRSLLPSAITTNKME